MNEMQNEKELQQLNDQLGKEMKNFDRTSKEEFQGYHPKEEKEKRKRRGKKKRSIGQILRRILAAMIILVILVVAAFFIVRAIGKSSLFGSDVNMKNAVNGADIQNNGDLVIYKGHKYRYNKNVTSILFMGIDREKINSDEKFLKENGAGQADSLFLAVLDTSAKKLTLLSIPRDIMADMKTYDAKGKYDGSATAQLCLAYAYGDGKEKSCTNTVETVSKVLYGIPIDSYMSINLSAISVLNDAIGGVNVQVIGDLTSADPALKEGDNVTLLGDQAETYVRTREHEPLDANMERMQRQRQYVAAYGKKALQEFRSDIMVPVDLFRLVSKNAVTNLSMTKLTYLATAAANIDFSSDDIQSIECTIKEGKDGYAEYYPKEKKLFEKVLKIFYTRVD